MRCKQSGLFLPKMIRALVSVCVLSVLNVARCHEIHGRMTAEETLSVFQTGPDQSVPPYEVVPILHSVDSEGDEVLDKAQIHLKAFGKNYKLSLKPTKGLFKKSKHVPMWTVTRNNSNPDGLYYQEVEEASTDVGDIYQDEETMSSILLHKDNGGKVQVEGNIGSDLVIRSLPVRVLKEIVDKTEGLGHPDLLPNVTSREKRSLRLTNHHVVFRRSSRPVDDEYSDFMLMEPDHLSKRFRSKRSVGNRSKRQAPYVIYPEILCIVDYDGYRLHGGDNVQIKRYFVSFWNGVDLRYKLLKGPKIRISIAGIIISRGRDATPYLERNRVGRDAIDSAAALTDMGKYLFRERRLPVYDIAVAVTKLDMCRRQYANDVCNRGTAGFAYVGGACVVNKRLEKVNSVAIIEDTGGFSGIIVAAHEVGHLLGAVHDGSPPPSYLGGPGAEKCRWEDGYIMSDLRHTEKGFKWSHCSVSSFHHFLNGDTATCLYNAPHEDEALPRVLPGKLLSLDAQCRKDRGTSACFKDDRVCAQLFCFDAGSGYCVAYRPAAEGSPCGDGQYCLNGRCVAEHENIIPDYTQNIPSYVRHDYYHGGTQNRRSFGQINHTDLRSPWEATTEITTEYKYPDPYSDPYSNPYADPSPYNYETTEDTPTTYRYNYYHYGTEASPYSNDQNAINGYDKTQENEYSYEYPTTTTTTTTTAKSLLSNYLNNYYHKYGYTSTTTTARSFLASKYYGNTRDPFSQKITAYKYKNPTTTASFTSSKIGDQYGRHGTSGRGTRDGECIDVATDCADLIDRLRTWLCHLQSVKDRCCASLKGLCND